MRSISGTGIVTRECRAGEVLFQINYCKAWSTMVAVPETPQSGMPVAPKEIKPLSNIAKPCGLVPVRA